MLHVALHNPVSFCCMFLRVSIERVLRIVAQSLKLNQTFSYVQTHALTLNVVRPKVLRAVAFIYT